MAGGRSRVLGSDRSPGQLPCSLLGLSSSPFSHPGIVSDIPGRLALGSSLAARDRGDACQRSLRNCPRSGSRLLQSPFPGGEGLWQLETRDRSLSPERVRPADSVQDGNSRFCTVICQRGGFSSFPGSEGRVLSDPNPSIFEETIEVHVGGDGLPVPSPLFRSVDRYPGLHQGLRGRVRVGTLPRDQTSPLSGRLVGSLLFGAGSQAVRPVAPLALSHPRDCDKREEVRSRALADCEVSKHDHRYRGQQGFSVSGASRCSGRSPQPLRASCRDRVVSPLSGGEVTASCLGQSFDRPCCDVPQCKTAPVLLASPRSPGRLRGRVSTSFGRPGSVRVPSLSSGRSGDRPCPRVVACSDGSGRTPLAGEEVVCRLTSSTDPTTSRPALVGQSVSAAPLQPLPPRHPRAEPSCMATLKRHFRKSGFSGRAARVLSGCLRSSTSCLYQLRWQIFCGWCRGRGIAPVNAPVPVVVDFLIHLRHDKSLSVSAVKGYSSALNSVLALKGRDLASSRNITMLLRSFSRSVDPVELRPPAWGVALVFQSLTGAPYEPLRTCDERFLAQKTLFLLALASAKRIGELHALSYRVSHSGNWGEVSFSFIPGFAAKTQDSSSLAPRFEGFTVPALTNARNNRNGRLLCPVRVVRHYLDRTAAHRPRCELLFVTAGRSNKEISKITVSFWLRKTISRAYELSDTEQPVPAPRARETRYRSVSSFQEELRCRPGVEGGYVAQAYHLYAPLLEGSCPSVPRHLPSGPFGGGTGLGLTLACSPGHSTPNDSGLTFDNSILLSFSIHPSTSRMGCCSDGKCVSTLICTLIISWKYVITLI